MRATVGTAPGRAGCRRAVWLALGRGRVQRPQSLRRATRGNIAPFLGALLLIALAAGGPAEARQVEIVPGEVFVRIDPATVTDRCDGPALRQRGLGRIETRACLQFPSLQAADRFLDRARNGLERAGWRLCGTAQGAAIFRRARGSALPLVVIAAARDRETGGPFPALILVGLAPRANVDRLCRYMPPNAERHDLAVA